MELTNYNSAELFDISMFEIDQEKQMVNITKIAKVFGKNISDWTRNAQTQSFMNDFKEKYPDTQILLTIKGGNKEQGTWCFPELVIHFCKWISNSLYIKALNHYGNDYCIYLLEKSKREEIYFGEEVIKKLFNGYNILTQFSVLKYKIDYYIPELNLAIEFDEIQHFTPNQMKKDQKRESEIKSVLNCKFLRWKQ